MQKILIVDDDQAIRDVLTAALEDRFAVVMAADAAAALYQIKTERPDLVLLDLVLPDVDGLLLLYQIRRVSTVPIVVLTARQNLTDRVVALKAGADDFIDKPFDLDDLDARVDAVLRRSMRTPEPEAVDHRLRAGSFSISPTRGARIDDAMFYVSPAEHRLLTLLATHPEQVISYEVLLECLCGGASEANKRVLEGMLLRLRARLRALRGAPVIVTEKAKGLRLYAHA